MCFTQPFYAGTGGNHCKLITASKTTFYECNTRIPTPAAKGAPPSTRELTRFMSFTIGTISTRNERGQERHGDRMHCMLVVPLIRSILSGHQQGELSAGDDGSQGCNAVPCRSLHHFHTFARPARASMPTHYRCAR